MPDSKITALTSISTSTDPANDPLVIVDVSDTSMAATGTTKKVTLNQLLGAGGTATLASATITGDLTVRTNKLLVTNTGVGFGMTPITPFSGVVGTTGAVFFRTTDPAAPVASPYIQAPASTGFSSISPVYGFWYQGCGIGNPALNNVSVITDSTERYKIDITGIATWSNVGGVAGTAMTLNSTGLGVGTTPANGIKLAAYVATDGAPATSGTTQSSGSLRIGAASTVGVMDMGTAGSYSWIQPCNATNLATNYNLVLNPNGGNVGIGVTPSAWGAGYKALQLGNGLSLMGSPLNGTIAGNAWFDGTNWKYITANPATLYYASFGANGSHVWSISSGVPSAGGNVSLTNAMTLDASGNLLVKKTAQDPTVIGFEAQSNGTVNSTLGSAVNANATFAVYSTGAAAYRFYVGMGGTVYATNTTISAISDARLKENVQDIDVGLGAILALKPRKFDWKAGKGKDIKGDRGFIAQEFETVFPNLIDEWKDQAPEGEAPYKSVRQDLIPVLVKAIQELAARVQTLETR